MKLLLIPAMVLTISWARPQAVDWARTYGGTSDDFASGVKQLPGGGFIVGGTTTSFGHGGSDMYLLRLNSRGDTLWTRTYGGGFNDACADVVLASDGGYVLAGYYSTHEGKDVWVLKTDTNGNPIWSRLVGSYLDDIATSIAETRDSGFILTGYTTDETTTDIYLVRLNSRGDSLWTSVIRRPGNDSGMSVIETDDGDFVIVGTVATTGRPAACFLRVDSRGHLRWMSLAYGGDGAYASAVVHANDGGFVATWMQLTPYPHARLRKFDSLGSTQWDVGFPGYTSIRGLAKLSGGGFILTGRTFLFPGASDNIALIRTEENGDTVWTRTIDGAGSDSGSDVIETSNGGYLLAGSTTSIGAGGSDAYIVMVRPSPSPLYLTPSAIDFGAVAIPECRRDSVRVENRGTDTLTISSIFSTNPRFLPQQTALTIPPSRHVWVPITYCAQFPPGTQSGIVFFAYNTGVEPEAVQVRAQTITTSVDTNETAPIGFSLGQNYPNPFNPSTNIKFLIPTTNYVTLKVFDLLGREVATLVDEEMQPGSYERVFEAKELASGIYFYKLSAGTYSQTRKLILLR